MPEIDTCCRRCSAIKSDVDEALKSPARERGRPGSFWHTCPTCHTCTMWASDLDQFDNTCADADGATGRAEISCPMSGPFHTCVSLPRDSPFTRVTHGPHGREAMRFVYRHGIPTSTCVKGASKSVCTTSVRNTARMQGSGQQAISEKKFWTGLDTITHVLQHACNCKSCHKCTCAS